MLSDTFLLQLLLLIVSNIYCKLINVLTLWYAAGLYLIFLGLFLLADDADVFIGFLWVVDFGVGLIFFIFILHFSSFIYQKAYFDIFARLLIYKGFTTTWIILISCFLTTYPVFTNRTSMSWFFFSSWYNFYTIFLTFNISTLQLIREIYFFNNSFEFFLANFILLYGIFLAIILSFMLKKVFTILTFAQFQNLKLLHITESIYFIRQQDFVYQQNISTGTRVWKKRETRNDI